MIALAALTIGGSLVALGRAVKFVDVKAALPGCAGVDPEEVPPELETTAVVVVAGSVASGAFAAFSPVGHSRRRAGSFELGNLCAAAGVLRNAPGTGLIGVVCGYAMFGSELATDGSPTTITRVLQLVRS